MIILTSVSWFFAILDKSKSSKNINCQKKKNDLDTDFFNDVILCWEYQNFVENETLQIFSTIATTSLYDA